MVWYLLDARPGRRRDRVSKRTDLRYPRDGCVSRRSSSGPEMVEARFAAVDLPESSFCCRDTFKCVFIKGGK